MDPVVQWLFVLLPWAVIVFLGWVVALLLRQHGRALLSQDELRGRLAQAEERLGELADRLDEVHQLAAAGGGGGSMGDSVPAGPEGLPIGAPAPEFVATDLSGNERRLDDFLGRPRIVVFFSPQCGFCVQMAPRLGELSDGGSDFLLISRGDPDEHRKMAAEHNWRCEVVLQKEWEISSAYQANGTPTGYLLDAQGRIASNLAIGAEALLNLRSALPQAGGSNGNGHAADLPAPAPEAPRGARPGRDGLPAGTPAPEFSLPDLDGRQRSLADFRGKRVLLVFSDLDCQPCQPLAKELAKRTRKGRDRGLEVVFVSRGDAEANRARAREHGASFPILLQQKFEISRQYAMLATPVGYLIDEQGVIARDVAVGPEAILQLA